MRKHPILPTLLASAATLLLLLTGCAPAASGSQPQVAVLNGPAGGRIDGSARALEEQMAQQGPLRFGFVNRSTLSFAEGHNDFHHDRAITSAGRVARSYGARYAVLIGASTLGRKVTLSRDGSTRFVDVAVRMEAVVVDAASDAVVARLSSRTFERTRDQSVDTVVPPLQQDPTAQALRDRGVADIAPAVVGALSGALGIHGSSSGG